MEPSPVDPPTPKVIKGEKGDPGKDGKNGVDGANGKDGRNGIDGKDGRGIQDISLVKDEKTGDRYMRITYTDGTFQLLKGLGITLDLYDSDKRKVDTEYVPIGGTLRLQQTVRNN